MGTPCRSRPAQLELPSGWDSSATVGGATLLAEDLLACKFDGSRDDGVAESTGLQRNRLPAASPVTPERVASGVMFIRPCFLDARREARIGSGKCVLCAFDNRTVHEINPASTNPVKANYQFGLSVVVFDRSFDIIQSTLKPVENQSLRFQLCLS